MLSLTRASLPSALSADGLFLILFVFICDSELKPQNALSAYPFPLLSSPTTKYFLFFSRYFDFDPHLKHPAAPWTQRCEYYGVHGRRYKCEWHADCRHSTLWLFDVGSATVAVCVSMVMALDSGTGLDIRYDNNIERDNLLLLLADDFYEHPRHTQYDNSTYQWAGPMQTMTSTNRHSVFVHLILFAKRILCEWGMAADEWEMSSFLANKLCMYYSSKLAPEMCITRGDTKQLTKQTQNGETKMCRKLWQQTPTEASVVSHRVSEWVSVYLTLRSIFAESDVNLLWIPSELDFAFFLIKKIKIPQFPRIGFSLGSRGIPYWSFSGVTTQLSFLVSGSEKAAQAGESCTVHLRAVKLGNHRNFSINLMNAKTGVSLRRARNKQEGAEATRSASRENNENAEPMLSSSLISSLIEIKNCWDGDGRSGKL